ncbi:EamA family transporter [Phormidium tenue FACHB-886]|nr:EamA family transporter [Phormidium tenue FACHB-886]
MKIQDTAQASGRSGLLLILLAAVLWGTIGLFVQTLYRLTETNPLSIGFLRLAISVPVLLLACWLSVGRQMFRVARADFALMLLIGGMMALYQVCYFGAIAQVGVAAATLITLCTAPVWVVLLAAVLLQERLTRTVLLSGGLAVAGTSLLVGLQPNSSHANPLLGLVLALGSSFGYALIVLLSRRLSGRYHPLQPLTIGFTAGAIFLFPFTVATGWVMTYPAMGWAALLYLGLVPTALAYMLYFVGIRTISATTASIATLLEPLTSTLLAAWLLGEQLGSWGLAGAVLLGGAIALLYRSQR